MKSIGVAVQFLPLYFLAILAFGYGAQLVREGKIHGGSSVIQVLLNMAHASEAFGQVENMIDASLKESNSQAIPYYSSIHEAQTLAADIFEVIERKSAIDPLASKGLI